MSDLPCPLLAEIHSNLIYNLRTVNFTRHSSTLSLLKLKESLGPEDRVFGVTIDELTDAMADIGNNWERVPLRHVEGREGWEDALVGCLKDVRISFLRSCTLCLPPESSMLTLITSLV